MFSIDPQRANVASSLLFTQHPESAPLWYLAFLSLSPKLVKSCSSIFKTIPGIAIPHPRNPLGLQCILLQFQCLLWHNVLLSIDSCLPGSFFIQYVVILYILPPVGVTAPPEAQHGRITGKYKKIDSEGFLAHPTFQPSVSSSPSFTDFCPTCPLSATNYSRLLLIIDFFL